MSEKPLLLSSAKPGILVVHHKEPTHWFRWVILTVGFLAVLIGGADVAARGAQSVFGDKASLVAFAPAAVLIDPSLAGPPVVAHVPFVPTRLMIRSLAINASVESVGKKSDGSMATPSTFYTVGWYNLGSKPGEAGNAVFAGHVNNALTTAGVFEHLGRIKVGDTIEVFDKDSRGLTFTVEEINDYPRTDAPLETIFATTGPSRIVLITCDGDWDPKARSYEKRLVVVAHLTTP